MASKRAVQLLALRVPQVAATRAAAARFSTQCTQCTTSRAHTTARTVPRIQRAIIQHRHHSAFPSDKRSKVYEFKDVLDILENPRDSTLLIDVREPAEYAANAIPTALNLPISSQPDALLLSEEEFAERFGWQKPPPSTHVVFYCKAGVRSSAAAQLAKQAGYENVGEYRGSWLDWERNGGPGTKNPPPPGGKGEPSEAEVREDDSQGNSITKGNRTDPGYDGNRPGLR